MMELTLNLAWMMLTVLMSWLWVRYAPQKGPDKRTQVIALALVLMILFPVISVTDDIVWAQNPAEMDSVQRRSHAVEDGHKTPHPTTCLSLPETVSTFSEFCQFLQQGYLPPASSMAYAMDRIQNRPPPVA